jgi:hypothetical protein
MANDALSAVGQVVGGWKVVRPLGTGSLLVCRADEPHGSAGMALFVMRPVPADCLIAPGRLHEQVQLRLERLRDLPELSIITAAQVLWDGRRAWLVRKWVEGQWLGQEAIPAPRLLEVARALVGIVERSHLLGMVHGAIKPTNIIVTPDASVVLTDVSVYWQDRPDIDIDAVVRALRQANGRLRPPDARLAMALGPAAEQATLRDLRGRIGTELSPEDNARQAWSVRPGPHAELRRARRQQGAIAAVLAAAGCAAAAAIWWYGTGAASGLSGGVP